MRAALAAVPPVLLGACSTGGDPPSAEPSSSTTTEPDASATRACAEVRAGIDDFNLGDFQGTVAHFQAAVPLARTQAHEDSSPAADDLLEAVTYYAELAPADYPSASATSPDFAAYKEITLGQCVAPGQEPGHDPSEAPGTST
jgi:hypothetical protein